MYGIEAINAANGWNMAALGILVVFSSLIILSIIISQLHKILILWEKRKKLIPGGMTTDQPYFKNGNRESGNENNAVTPGNVSDECVPHPRFCPEDILEVAAIWAPLAEKLGEPFSLGDLYKLAAKNNFPHPHLTIQRLRQENILVPSENGTFFFNYEKEKT